MFYFYASALSNAENYKKILIIFLFLKQLSNNFIIYNYCKGEAGESCF